MDAEKSFGPLRATAAEPLVRLHVFLNEKSGVGRAGDLRERLQKAADQRDLSVVFHEIGGEDRTAAEVRRILDHREKNEQIRVIVAGGDGSIRSVARVVAGSNVQLGVIPTGTFNYFARTHEIPVDEDKATQIIMDGHCESVQIGLANEDIFLVNLSLGSYADSIAARERTTKKLGRNRLVAFLATLWTLFWSRKRIRVEVRSNRDGAEFIATPFVFVGNNRLQLENFDAEVARGVGDGILTTITARTTMPWQKIWMILQACLIRLKKVQAVTIRRGSGFVLTSRKGSAPVALDGELVELQYPIRIRAWQGAIQLLVPRRNSN